MLQPTVLVAEDDTQAGEVLAEILADANYAPTLVQDGSEAIDLLATRLFAVVVSDIQMPTAGGIDVLHTARQASTQPEVILLTGHGSLETALVALREGAFDYLLKPYDPTQLLQRVADAVAARNARLRQSEAIQRIIAVFDNGTNHTSEPISPAPTHQPSAEPTDQAIRVGMLMVGPTHHTVTYAGQPMHVTPTEHALLRCLAAESGKVFPYCALAYAMYGYDVTSMEAKILLKTHIRNLRHKLGPGWLVNVRSAGYKLVAPATRTISLMECTALLTTDLDGCHR